MKRLIVFILVMAMTAVSALIIVRMGNKKNQHIKSKDFVLTRLSGEVLAFPVPHKKTIVIFWQKNNFISEYYVKKLNQMLIMGQVSVNDIIVIVDANDRRQVEKYLEENLIQLLVAENTNETTLNSERKNNPYLVFINEQMQIVYESSIPHPNLEKDTLDFLSKAK